MENTYAAILDTAKQVRNIKQASRCNGIRSKNTRETARAYHDKLSQQPVRRDRINLFSSPSVSLNKKFHLRSPSFWRQGVLDIDATLYEVLPKPNRKT